jgi:asparagine synthase (glutamine-hydrolysing)
MDEVVAMCSVMVHRGPDHGGYRAFGSAALGMRRLSIIDLKTGDQPICNEDRSVWVVMNGEIYNFRDLRRDLEKKGHVFRTAADTETLVHLYEEYGADLVTHLRGMFAFALWDDRQHMLVLARDRLGIKPLYFAEAGGRLLFASELKAILQMPDVKRTLNWTSVDHLFTFLCTPLAESIVEGIHKLEPGTLLILDAAGRYRLRRYWEPQFLPDYTHDEAYYAQRLAEMLDESVMLHQVSDVPLGAFLSGGIDSSAVVASLSRLGTQPVKTFSIGFREPAYDETPYARRIANHFGTEHHELILEPGIEPYLDDLIWCLDEPFGDSSCIPTYIVSKLAARHVKVVLSGDGGDELFAGYDRYRVEQREQRYTNFPMLLRRLAAQAGSFMPEGFKGRNFLQHMALDGAERYLDASVLFSYDRKHRLFQPDVMQRIEQAGAWRNAKEFLSTREGHWLSVLQEWDLRHYLPLDILTKVDRMSMAHSLETRVPLLDHKLVEFALTIPTEYSLTETESKRVLKRAMRSILPDETIERRKQGFAVPLGQWFRQGLSGFVQELLLSDCARQRGIFERRYIERLLRMHMAGRNLDLQIWTLVSFELWCRMFLDRTQKQESSSGLHDRPVQAGSRATRDAQPIFGHGSG